MFLPSLPVRLVSSAKFISNKFVLIADRLYLQFKAFLLSVPFSAILVQKFQAEGSNFAYKNILLPASLLLFVILL